MKTPQDNPMVQIMIQKMHAQNNMMQLMLLIQWNSNTTPNK